MALPKQRGKIITIILCAIIVTAIGVGVYLLFQYYKTLGVSSNSVNKYNDLVDWCESSTQNDELTLNCKALLLSIKSSQEDTSSCFNVEIISKENTLKDASICENSSTLSYTNDVLVYKKLMPIKIDLTFKKDGLLQTYTFQKVSIEALVQESIQDIIKEDITSLISMDLSNLQVKNSINFCPNPTSLANDLSADILAEYTQFYNDKRLSYQEYSTLLSQILSQNSQDIWNKPSITVFDACDSAENSGYTDICSTDKLKVLDTSYRSTTALNAVPVWGTALDIEDVRIINQISVLKDSIYYKKEQNANLTPDLIDDTVYFVNAKQNVNEETLCNLYYLYNTVDEENTIFKSDKTFIYDTVLKNSEKLSSSTCASIISDKVDPSGLYIEIYLRNLTNDSILNIYNRCNNLSMYIKNENT